jgi:membrane-associated phospholipid phosphatase
MTVSPFEAMAVRVLGVSAVLLFGATLAIVGPHRLRTSYGRLRDRLVETAPYIGLLAAVLVVNKVARDVGPDLSWAIGWNITSVIYAVEGDLVVLIQSVATPGLTAVFAAVYLVGYVFMLAFPIVAYLMLPEERLLKTTAVAYAVNYGIGVLCYILFVAYGPRNLLPGQVESLLYVAYPKTQILTGAVNVNTNVFPSLHTSLSVTVAALAIRSRDVYPVWGVVAPCLAAAVALSTMYLGIHWAVDVAAGILLGIVSTAVAVRVVDRRSASG